MANVGEKTGKKTQAGRDVYKTSEGKMVSEKSTTFEYRGKWINIPTIHDGKQYSQDQLIDMLDKGLIKPTSVHDKLQEAVKAAKNRSKSLKFNEGGLSDYRKRIDPPEQYKNMFGDRSEKPLSVQMAEVGVEFTPVGTVSGVLDIKEELESEDPDYTDVALMVGTELLGLTPVGETGSKLIGGVKSRFKDRNLQRAADLLRKELGNKNPRNEFRDLNEARRNKSAIPYDVNERIWNETGWYVDPLDGQWRYEIDDSQAKMFPKGFVNTQTKNNTRPVITYEEFKTDPYAKVTFKLGDILSHDELYKNYPKFKDADVELYSEADNNILGWFSQDLDRIGLNAARLDSNEELKSTLLHEIQHMIQKKEGFSRGSNKSSDEVLARLGAEKENEFARYGNLKNKQLQLKAKLRSRINAPTPQVRNDLIDQIQDLEREIQSIENFLKDDNTLQYALYRGAGGEIEARLVQRRMNLTSGERAADQRTSDNYDFFVEGDSVGGFPLADRNIMIAEDSNLPNYAEGALDVARKIDDRREPGPLSFFGKLKRKYDDLFNKFAEGGTVAMNEQMSFAFADGGLRDDGMKEDPVSGNEVPPGSTAKEVRDEIPAQLSEGEYVVPADVVRYYGVKFFEDLRDAAKMGLQDMEARGRIGGEPVPAGGPMNEDDLTPEELAAIQEMMGMSEGGTVAGFAPGGLQTDQDILAAGQQAQQNQFTGFPLGATIFPRAESGEIEAVPTTPTITTEETAESCAAKDMDYDPATKTCVPRVVATTTPAPSDDDDGPRVEPPKWHEKYDYADTNKLVSQSLATLGVDSGTEEKETQNTLQKIAGSIGQGIGNMLEGGILGGIIRQQKVAEVAANAQLLRAQGRIKEAEMLEDAIDGYRDKHDIEPGGFFDSTKTLAKQLADKYSDLTYDEENETIIKPGSTTTKPPTPTSTPTSTPTTTPKPTKSPATAAKSLAKQASNADNSAQLAAIQKAQSIAQKAADAGTSIAEQTQTGSGGYGSSSQVEEETGGQGDQGLGSGWGGMNAGGLMAGKPKTKTKRQYKKGGLAGKK